MTTDSLAGVARVDITPRAGVMLEAYHRKESSTGVLDPLYATALALATDPKEPFLIIAIDHVALLISETEPIRDAIAAKLSIPRERAMVCPSIMPPSKTRQSKPRDKRWRGLSRRVLAGGLALSTHRSTVVL